MYDWLKWLPEAWAAEWPASTIVYGAEVTTACRRRRTVPARAACEMNVGTPYAQLDATDATRP